MKHFYRMFLAVCFLGWQATYAAETEPNNTTAQANTLALNGTNSGKMNAASDADWWKITTTANGKLSVKLTPLSRKKLWLYLYDNNGTTILQSGNSDSIFTKIQDGLGTGTYYLKVVAALSTDTLGYSISNTFATATPANDTEPNNTKASALTLANNATMTGHVGYYYNLKRDTADWYKITTTADRKLRLKLTPANGQQLSVALYANNGTSLINSASGGSTFSMITDGLKKDVYYVKVNAKVSSGFAAYTLTDSLYTPTTDTFVLAERFAYQTKISTKGKADWWKITTTKNGKLTFTLTPLSGKYLWVYLYDRDRSTLLNSSYSSAKFVQATDGLAAGTYYAKVVPFYATDTSSYIIADTLTTPAQANDMEPNDSRATAIAFSPSSSKTGHVGYYYNLKRDTSDWYKITTTGDGALKLDITPANGSYTWAYLYDNNGTTLINSVYTSTTASLTADGLAAGTYYVRVNCYYTNQFAPYTLKNTFIKVVQANDTEPNNTKAQAVTFSPNSSRTGHVGYYYNLKRDTSDWYKITTTGDGMLKLNVTPVNGSYLWVYLYDNDGTTILKSAYSTAAFTMNTDGLAAGTYYVRITCYYNNHFTPYLLSNTLTSYPYTNDTEPNQKPFQAQAMAANSTVNGHVNFYYNKKRDDADWWKLSYTGTGSLALTFKIAPRHIDGVVPYTWIYVYKDTSASPIHSSYYNTASNNINLSALAKGNYYIKIITYYASDFAAYSISNGSAATLTTLTMRNTDLQGTEEALVETRVRVYPNPAATQLRITAPARGNGLTAVVLKDASGKQVWSAVKAASDTGGSTLNVDVSRYAAGIYFLTITDRAGNVTTQKVVIAR